MPLPKEHLIEILESISDGFISMDNRLVVNYFNKAAEEMLGRQRTEVLGQNLFEAFPETRGSIFEKKFGEAVTTKRPLSFETFFDVPPYTNWYDVRVSPSENGIAVYFMVITARKQAEEKLRESERVFRNLFNNTEIAMFRSRLDGTATLDANDKFLELVGRTREEVIGKPSVTYWLDPRRRREMAELLNIHGRVRDFPLQMLNKMGEVRDCLTSLNLYPDEGILDGSILDITERKRAEEALAESEARFREFAEQALVGISVIQDGELKYVNPKFADMFGYGVEECTSGMSFKDVVCPEDLPSVAEWIRKRIDGEIKTAHYTFRGRRKGGQIIYLEVFGSSVRYKGRTAAIGTLLDITEKKLAETQLQQAQKLEAIGTLAGGIAHDFNNILGVILGYTGMAITDAPPGSSFAKELDQVLIAANRAKDLVKQILAFSRQSLVEPIPIKIQPLIKEGLKMLRSSLPTTISISSNVDQSCCTILADPTQVHQILMNLCTNAYHAMEEIGGDLSVALQTTVINSSGGQANSLHLTAGKYVELTVADTGCGIGPDILDKIFDPFFTTKKTGKGTGMGLAIVHGIVSGYGGAITVESQLGNGTTFHVYFPAINEKALPKKIESEEIPGGKERILFVDDEELLAKLGKDLLARLGYRVTIRQSSIEALETFQDSPQEFDLVITDQTMPGMTGSELARRMLQVRPDIPIILCTGYSNLIDESSAKAIGIKEFTLKPLAREQVGKLIRKVLDAPLHEGAN